VVHTFVWFAEQSPKTGILGGKDIYIAKNAFFTSLFKPNFMKRQKRSKYLLLGILLCLPFLFLQAQTTVSGKITDGELNEPLIGANIIIKGTTIGASTDLDGQFEISSSQALPWTLEVSYTGFEPQTIEVSQARNDLSIVMNPSAIMGQEVVISASRRREKIQEAPASISVLGERKLSVSPQVSPVRNMINVPGVQIQQQSAGTMNISMRGEALLFNTTIFPIMDYRSLVGPGIGTFSAGGSGINSVDLKRIEIVRGPGSALYGPGVTSGVIHFITKNPIDYPGTAIEVFGGEGSTYGFFARHAGKSKTGKFGYKINAQYARGDEFQLDPVEDAEQIAKLKKTVSYPIITNGVVDVSQPGEVVLTEDDLDPDRNGNPMQDHYWSTAFNGTLEFRPTDDLNVTVAGGMNQASGVFYNSQGEGLMQFREFWGQARVQKGGLFAQFFYVDNDGGTRDRPTFLYQTGLPTGIARKQIEGQIQYNFDVPALLDANFTAGIDSRTALSDSQNLVYGRTEDDDDYRIFGAYLQGKFKLGDKLDMVLAGRYDTFNFLDDGAFSPRVAFVFKPSPKHTFRTSYNRANSPPTALNIAIDLPVATPVPGLFDLWLVGTKNQHTYENPTIDVTIPGVPNLPVNTPGLPLAVPYGLVNEAVIAQLGPALGANPALAPLVPAIEAFLRDPANTPQGFTGALSAYNIFNRMPFGELKPTEEAQLSVFDNFELGYKGLINDKLSVTADLYYIKRKGFTLFSAVGPTYALNGADIPTDLGAAVQNGITPFLVETLTPLLGDAAEATAAALAGQIGAGYSVAGEAAQAQLAPLFPIFGAVESSLIPQGDNITHVSVGYRSDAESSIDYWGADIGLEYYINNDLAVFANYSWNSKNRWGPGNSEEFDGELPFAYSLNSPKNKYRIGLNYTPAQGIFGSLSFQHDDEFFGQFGQFQGMTGGNNIVDASIGYKFNDNFQITLAGTNVFNTAYRAFVNFPQIKRRLLVKALYKFGGE
jgi:iron complex outermembrane receptor protein